MIKRTLLYRRSLFTAADDDEDEDDEDEDDDDDDDDDEGYRERPDASRSTSSHPHPPDRARDREGASRKRFRLVTERVGRRVLSRSRRRAHPSFVASSSRSIRFGIIVRTDVPA